MFKAKDLGIDLGTANILVYIRGEGVVMQEPSVVAIQKNTKEILAVGSEAKQMIGRTPENIVAIRPMKDGVIADFDVAQAMLRYFINKTKARFTLIKPAVVIGVPTGITAVEERAVKDAALQAGAKDVMLLAEPMAAAIGSGMPVGEPTGNMIVDIGGGTTEVAVISLGGIVTDRSIRVGGDEMDAHIVSYLKRKYNLLVGERTAEDLKMKYGSAYFTDSAEDQKRKNIRCSIRGRDLVEGLPKNVELTGEEICEALKEPVGRILEGIRYCLEHTPPELSSDIMDKGIVLAGGGSLLYGLDKLVRDETHMPVYVAEQPLTAVAEGTGIVVENLDKWRKILANVAN
ncbi:rod shape-determining protein [Clostridia bacterium]|nr:rod shape-determining protein [Clostridia bacterium]